MPSVGMLLCTGHSNNPPTAVVSALLPSAHTPSTSSDPHVTPSDHASRDAYHISKSSRRTSRAVKAAKRSAVPMEAEQIPMSKKQAKRLYIEPACDSNESAEKPHSLQKSAPFADLTNNPALQVGSSARPKRTAVVKAPIIDQSDSASDAESSSSSDFEPDSYHASDDGTDIGVSDIETDELDECATAAGTRQPPTSCDRTQIASAQLTFVDCTPPIVACTHCSEFPPIPCARGAAPRLKFFHELSEEELKQFMTSDELTSSCVFCGARPDVYLRQDLAGASILKDHYFKNGKCHKCTWPGCTGGFLNLYGLTEHYVIAHDHSLCRAEALTMKSVKTAAGMVAWEDPVYCSLCRKWYAEFEWIVHERYHDLQQLVFDISLPVQGVQLSGLRAGDKCPFEDCDALYRDFTGWFIHCTDRHAEYIAANGGLPIALNWEKRMRAPMFRCTSCSAGMPIGQVQRHHMQCTASVLPETVGLLMRQRAATYDEEPDLLKLEYGVRIMERKLMGFLEEATAPSANPHWVESSLREIRRDDFVLRFVQRNQSAPVGNVLYCVTKIRRGVLPGLRQWVTECIPYVGHSIGINERIGQHISNSFGKWAKMGLSIREDEALYIVRMHIRIDGTTSTKAFNDADLRRMEQLLIDALGVGTLYNVDKVLAAATKLNDTTYRNHIAPRLTQLAYLLFQSTHATLSETGLVPDNQNVWELAKSGDGLDVVDVSAARSNAQASDSTIPVEQSRSPIPAPRLVSPEVYDGYLQLQEARGYTDEQMLERIRAWRSRKDTLRHAEGLVSDDPRLPQANRVQPHAPDPRSSTSPDLFAALYPNEDEEVSCNVQSSYDFNDVPTTSNGSDYSALEQLSALTACINTVSRPASCSEPDKSHTTAGESVQSGIPRQHSVDPPDSSPNSVSASTAAVAKAGSGAVPPTIIRQCTLRIPSYGGRSTQYVDLSREPVDLSQDVPSEASHDEPSHELSDASSESSDEEPQREILDVSPESSLAEPSPTDSGFFDFENVPGTGRKPVYPNLEDSVQDITPKDSAENAIAALPLDEEEKEAESDTYDQCAHKNCRRPQYNNINWVQCDDCDEWYHNMCILGEETAFEEAEFHCECAQNGKRKPGRAQRSKKQ